jgi:NAD(P)-dependent dehydrogenase (short-subunit alcohol dehydrogenase family)
MHDRVLIESTQRCQDEPFFNAQGQRYNLPFTPLFPAVQAKLIKPSKCYVCKQAFQVLHHFYHRLCPACAAENYARRSDTADLTGYHALLTGGRIKIGFEIALMLLRAGATVLVTTRFANNAYQRFQAQPDFAEWQARLYVYGIDLRSLEAVQQLIVDVQNFFPKLDILINNAAQTITRPVDYYLPLIQQEQQYLPQSKQILQLAQHTPSNALAVFKQQAIALDEFNEPLDMRKQNSWRETLATVQTRELVETQVVNSIVPFMLCSQLKPLLMRSQNWRFIINVSAMEGQFNRVNKTHYHPHTNMAKAALNMLTRTAAMDYVRDGIYMNSVDTGWVTIEDPFATRQKNRLNGMVPPLDCVDGAARVMAPIWEGIHGNLYYGQFLKDYKPTQW